MFANTLSLGSANAAIINMSYSKSLIAVSSPTTIWISFSRPSLFKTLTESSATLSCCSMPIHLQPNTLLNIIKVNGSGPEPKNMNVLSSLNLANLLSFSTSPIYLS